MTRSGLLEPSWSPRWCGTADHDGDTPVEKAIPDVRRQQGVHPRVWIGVDASAGAYFERHAPSGIGRVT